MRLAVLPDFVEEGWLSMEYCAERLLAHLPDAVRMCPPYHRYATRLSGRRKAVNADRVINRYIRYPRFAARIQRDFDAFHIVDHSYAHLARSVPAERVGVYCHDLDTFGGVLKPERHSRWFRELGEHLLIGLRRATVVFVNAQETRRQLIAHELVGAERIIHAPLGVAEEFTTTPSAVNLPWLDTLGASPWILHVGSCVPRKRIDVLLDLFAEARRAIPDLRLLKISGEFNAAHQAQIDRLGLRSAITHQQGLSRAELAAVYRAAPLVVIPSEAEGFGLPALEAVACGAKVLASDLPSLREAGGDAVVYRPVADIPAWSRAVVEAFEQPTLWPDASRRAAHAAEFTWVRHAAIIQRAYEALLQRGAPR